MGCKPPFHSSPLSLCSPLMCLVLKHHAHITALACLTCSLLLENTESVVLLQAFLMFPSRSPQCCLVSISLSLTLASVHTSWPTQRFLKPHCTGNCYQGLQVASYRKSSSTIGLVSEPALYLALRLCLLASRPPNPSPCIMLLHIGPAELPLQCCPSSQGLLSLLRSSYLPLLPFP